MIRHLSDAEISEILERYRPYDKRDGREALAREYGVPTSIIKRLTSGIHRRYKVAEGDSLEGLRDVLDWGPVLIADTTRHHRAAIDRGLLAVHSDRWVRATENGIRYDELCE